MTNRVPNLPDLCYIHVPHEGIAVVKNGEMGYYQLDYVETRSVDVMNEQVGVTKQQAAALRAGSMFGFHTPAADPERYDANGEPLMYQRGRDLDSYGRRKS